MVAGGTRVGLLGLGLAVGLGVGVMACASAHDTSRVTAATELDAAAAGAIRGEIGRVLDDFHAAAAASDLDRYFGHFAARGVFLGTDASERWDVAAFRAYAAP